MQSNGSNTANWIVVFGAVIAILAAGWANVEAWKAKAHIELLRVDIEILQDEIKRLDSLNEQIKYHTRKGLDVLTSQIEGLEQDATIKLDKANELLDEMMTLIREDIEHEAN